MTIKPCPLLFRCFRFSRPAEGLGQDLAALTRDSRAGLDYGQARRRED